MKEQTMTTDTATRNEATDKILSVKEDGIGWLIFNNPERRNAVSPVSVCDEAVRFKAVASTDVAGTRDDDQGAAGCAWGGVQASARWCA